jgi:ABC-2 type transport system ATP-binding protein
MPRFAALRAYRSVGGSYMGMQEPAIVVEDLHKTYGATKAVDGISFTVGLGEIFGMLGPNGAGKSTTIEIVEGLRVADSGVVTVLGLKQPRAARAIKSRIGIQLQTTSLYPRLTVTEILDLFHQFYPNRQTLSTEQLISMVDLSEKKDTRSKQLSGGQKQRLSVALAMVNDPDIVFLDEPTTGMDPQARRATWDIIQQQQAGGATILLTTHFMDEAERLADRIAIMDGGQLIALDTPAALTTSQSTTGTELRFRAQPGLDLVALGKLSFVRAAHEESPGVYAVETGEPRELLVQLATLFRDTRVDVSEVRIGRSTLEDVFIRLTGKEMRE